MKKIFVASIVSIIVISIAVFIGIGVLSGRTNDTNFEETISESTDSKTENKVTLTNVDISQFPDAEDYDVYYWPTFGIASEIPAPAWSNRGWIDYDEADHFRCYVGYTTPDDFHNYIAELQDFGFVLNYFNDGDWRYYAENDAGWGILLYYWEDESHLNLEVARNHEDIEATYIF